MPTILPTAKTTFLGPNGVPLSGGKVYFYIPNTTTFKNTYQDQAQTILNANPVTLDANGQALIWGTGSYRQQVFDVNGNLIWDQVTQDTSGGLLGNMTDNTYVSGTGFTPGTTTQLILSSGPGSAANMWVYFDGVFQAPDQWSLTGTTVTFNSAIPVGVQEVIIKVGSTVAVGTPGSGTVTDVSVASNAGIQSTKLAYVGAQTGAVSRTVAARLGDFVSVKDFGAKGDGTTDDAQAFLNAFAASSSVYVPPGIYIISKQLAATNTNFTLVGAGPGVTELRFTGGTNSGINVTEDHNYRNVNFSDFDITTTTSGLGTAISVTYPGSSDSFNDRYDQTCTMTRVRVKQPTGTVKTAGWQNGVVFTELCNVVVTACSFTGQMTNAGTQDASQKSINGITFTGAFFPVDLKVSDSYFTSWDIAYVLGGPVQGVDINHCTHLFCRIGVQWFANPAGQPYLNVCDSHFNVFQNAITVTGINQSFIHGCLMYVSDHGLQIANLLDFGVSCSSWDIHDNTFVAYPTVYSCNLVVFESGEGTNKFHDNFISGGGSGGALCSTGVWLKSNCGPIQFNNNYFIGTYSVQSLYDQSGLTTQVFGRRGCLVSRTANLSIPNSSATAVTWDTDNYDTNSFWSSGSNITVPSFLGIHRVRVMAGVTFDGSGAGSVTAQIYRNGAGGLGLPIQSHASLGGNNCISISSAILSVAEGDTFSLVLTQSTGGAINAQGSGLTWMCIEVID